MAETQSSTQRIPGLTVGRDVHYFTGRTTQPGPDAPLEPGAAKIVLVQDFYTGTVNLTRFLEDGNTMPATDVPYSATPAAGCWSWMARV